MLRLLLEPRIQEQCRDENLAETPLRGSYVRIPRPRFLDKELELVSAQRSHRLATETDRVGKPSGYPEKESKECGKQSGKTRVQPVPKQICAADRFIPRRCQRSFEAANYLLTKKPAKPTKKNQLNVLKQLEELPEQWRKRSMHGLFARADVIPNLTQKRVLSGSVQQSTETRLPREFWEEASPEGGATWKSRPRKKPLIGIMDSILDIPTFQTQSRPRSQQIDWSATNLIAVVIQDSVLFYDVSLSKTIKPVGVFDVYSLKWSNDGYKLAICSGNAIVYVYNIVRQEFEWSVTCSCLETYKWECTPRCVCWSYNDQHVITTCRGLLSIFSARKGRCVKMVLAHDQTILHLGFSSDNRFLVSTAEDKNIRIFLWPELVVFLDISYYVPVQAIAWHPQQSGLLCVGGGPGDASLSLWNVNKVDPLSYRRVPFEGAVENLAWNKITGELVVHWSYWEDGTRYTVMPVLSSLDRIVDAIPLEKDSPAGAVLWNSDHTQLATQSEESFSIWNFFGSEYQYRHRSRNTRRDSGTKRKSFSRKHLDYFTVR